MSSYRYLDAAYFTDRIIDSIAVNEGKTEVTIMCEGRVYRMFNEQDCCESVRVFDVLGDLGDVLGLSVSAREDCSSEWPSDVSKEDRYIDSFTWTTYTFTTACGFYRIRWLGESNGYYSESVQIEEVTQ
jgi:hypothetical protein